MGNCVIQRPMQRSSIKDVVVNKEHQAGTSTLYNYKLQRIFHMRFWTHALGINLAEIEKCVDKAVQYTIQDKQKCEVTLSCSGQNPELRLQNQVECKTSLRCVISKQHPTFTCIFPFLEKNQRIWRFIHRWTPFLKDDILKIGKSKFKLGVMVEEADDYKRNIVFNQGQKNLKDIKIKKCRQCFTTQQEQNNPLLQPCKCEKALKYIHLNCLAKHLFNNISTKECLIIKVNQWACEDCKTDIKQMKVYKQLTSILLLYIEDIPKPFAILQNLHAKSEGIIKNFFILSFSNQPKYSIGRSSQASICQKNDKFISKIHCQIQYANNALMVRDCESLHGTLMKLNGSLQLSPFNKYEHLNYKNMLVKIEFAFQRQHIDLI